MTIEDETQAMRLARAILSDLGLYNEAAIRSASISVRRAVGREIEEGRQLFNNRVAEQCAGVFERELIAWVGRVRPDLADEPGFVPQREPLPRIAESEPQPRNAEEMVAREGERSTVDPPPSGGSVPVVIAAIVLIGSAAVWWFLRH